jgi:hypothetical protein
VTPVKDPGDQTGKCSSRGKPEIQPDNDLSTVVDDRGGQDGDIADEDEREIWFCFYASGGWGGENTDGKS